MTRAMQHADATVVVPMDFLRVPLTPLRGLAGLCRAVDLCTVLGAALILAGNVLNLRAPGRALAPRPASGLNARPLAAGDREARRVVGEHVEVCRRDLAHRLGHRHACSRAASPDLKPCSARCR